MNVGDFRKQVVLVWKIKTCQIGVPVKIIRKFGKLSNRINPYDGIISICYIRSLANSTVQNVFKYGEVDEYGYCLEWWQYWRSWRTEVLLAALRNWQTKGPVQNDCDLANRLAGCRTFSKSCTRLPNKKKSK